MTILVRIEKPEFSLTVCGSPSREWLNWVATTDVPLCADQLRWREVARRRRAMTDDREADE